MVPTNVKLEQNRELVPVSPATHALLDQWATATGSDISSVLERAVEQYRRYLFLTEANAAFYRLQQNPEDWAEEVTEREEWMGR